MCVILQCSLLIIIKQLIHLYLQRIYCKQHLQKQLEEILASIKAYREAYEDINRLISESDVDFFLSFQLVTSRVEALLASENKSLLRPVAPEEIPFFIARDINQQLKTLGAVGGGIAPTDLECAASSKGGNIMQLTWQLPEHAGRVLHFQIECKHLLDPSMFRYQSDRVYTQHEPLMHQVTGNQLSAYVDYLCPGYLYQFHIRSANAAGWGGMEQPSHWEV